MNPGTGLWLSPPIKAEDHKYWEIYDYAAFVDNAVLSTYSELCKEVRSLWTTPYHKERHARIHKHAQRLAFFCFLFFPTGWTEHHLQGCDGMHTGTRLWCKTRTVWNANHGENGERGEERSFFTVESIYIMLLFVSLNRVLLWRGTPMWAVMGNISPVLKQAAVANRTEWLPLLPLHQLSSSCESFLLPAPPWSPVFRLSSSVKHFAFFTFCNEETLNDNTITQASANHHIRGVRPVRGASSCLVESSWIYISLLNICLTQSYTVIVLVRTRFNSEVLRGAQKTCNIKLMIIMIISVGYSS